MAGKALNVFKTAGLKQGVFSTKLALARGTLVGPPARGLMWAWYPVHVEASWEGLRIRLLWIESKSLRPRRTDWDKHRGNRDHEGGQLGAEPIHKELGASKGRG